MLCKQCGKEIADGAAVCPHCGAAQITVVDARDGIKDSFAPTESFAPGRRLMDRYEIVCELGRGGMGVVYQAIDHAREADIALKTVPAQLRRDPRAIIMLKREVNTALTLTHENICRVYDFQECSEASFITMELIKGCSLDDLLLQREKEGACGFPFEQVVAWLKPICDALDYAHGKGVVHRDLKPGNVLVQKEGGVKLADFGLARAIRSSMSKFSIEATSGTLLYMSPEQCLGKPTDARSDIYSLGMMTHELLTGKHPFCDAADITYCQLHQTLPEISDLMPNASQAILSATAKSPSERFSTGGEFLVAFCEKGIVTDEPPEEKPSADMLGLKLGFPDTTGSLDEGCREWLVQAKTHYDRQQFDDAIHCCERILQAYPNNVTTLAAKGYCLESQRRPNEAVQCYDRALSLCPDSFALVFRKCISLWHAGDLVRALDCGVLALEIEPGNTDALVAVGMLNNSLGRYGVALTYFDRAKDLNGQTLLAWQGGAFALSQREEYEKALEYYDGAIRISDKPTSLWINKGLCFLRLKRYVEYIACCDEVLKREPKNATSLNNKADGLILQGRPGDALRYCDAAISNKPDNAVFHATKGEALNALGKFAEAVECFDRALALDPKYANAWEFKGLALKKMGSGIRGAWCVRKAERLRAKTQEPAQ